MRSGVAYAVQEYDCGNPIQLPVTRLVPSSPVAGDNFGSAIAVGDLDGDGLADVAVGAPNANANGGAVFTYGGRLPPGSPFGWSSIVTFGGRIDGAQLFGSAVAIGNIQTGGFNELAVGAPGGSGRVKVFNGGLVPTLRTTLSAASPATGDQFGAALAIGNVDRVDTMGDLVVGIPGDNNSRGAIAIFRGDSLTMIRTMLHQNDADPLALNEVNDRFGSSLAVGHLDGMGRLPSTGHTGPKLIDLAIGAPGEAGDMLFGAQGPAESGAVQLMRGTSGAIVSPWKTIDQLFSGQL